MVGERLFPVASAPSKKAARQLAAEEAVKALMGDGLLHVNKVKIEDRQKESLGECVQESKGLCYKDREKRINQLQACDALNVTFVCIFVYWVTLQILLTWSYLADLNTAVGKRKKIKPSIYEVYGKIDKTLHI